MLQRTITSKIMDALAFMPILLLRGARQTGKTTLAKAIAQEKGYTYITLDHLPALMAAKQDPVGFIAQITKPVILDEIQRVPELFLPIKNDVDQNRLPGRYFLTGSADPLLIPHLGDSLAGRMRLLNLWPLSQGEILKIHENFLDTLFDKTCTFAGGTTIHCSKENILQRALIGGYPTSLQALSENQRKEWFQDYVFLVLQKDILELSKIEDITQIPHLLMLLASRVGSLLNIEEVARSIKFSSPTLHRYLNLLRTLFLVHLLPAWSGNLSKRLVKSPKVYLTDTALQLFMLNMDFDRLSKDLHLAGNVIENFVVMELLKQVSWSNQNIQMFHYRDYSNTEVDILLEGPGGDLVGIEIKSSESISSDDFKGLKKVSQELGDKFIRGIVLYSGPMKLPFGEKFYALPISALWNN